MRAIEELAGAVTAFIEPVRAFVTYLHDNPHVRGPISAGTTHAIGEELFELRGAVDQLRAAAKRAVTSSYLVAEHVRALEDQGLPTNDNQARQLLNAVRKALARIHETLG